jgi:hypothetical protein
MIVPRVSRLRAFVVVTACACAAASLLGLARARPVGATTILPLDLAGLTTAADRIFHGRALAVRSGRDEHGLPSTWTTFAVDEAVKGGDADTIEIKQLGVDTPLPDGTLFRVPAIPSYRVGDEVILFLHPNSTAGFTSPVGLGQGRFRVRHHAGAAPVAENDVGNANLAPAGSARSAIVAPGASPTASDTAPGAMSVDELLTRVRAITGGTR